MPPQLVSFNFQGGASLYALYNKQIFERESVPSTLLNYSHWGLKLTRITLRQAQ